ncbi:(2Fe-2S)-binding protein [Sorangium cellulosum]|uniref:(2Fe-2S)-binding protein n=1 Tax=Sorangium cellulosum TaxID=56 RepID=A0A2L0F214_SORCE|nr:Rieske 2Fe-2S domain-containing protein [Sorangium cellulosum]AUX45577.1 (2Fe-2S)-binding protein [Sorangium cellulosum]
MIPNTWYPVLETSKVGRKPVGLLRLGERIVLFRGEDGEIRCFHDRCPHRGVALHLGRIVGNELECPYHGFRFGDGGQCTAMPCEGRGARPPKGMAATVFTVREAHGLVWLWWGASARDLGLSELPEIPWFDGLATSTENTFGYAAEWPQNYVRTIEANFDAHHFPFVHRWSVFSSPGTRVDPIHVHERDAGFLVDLYLREDDGLPIEASRGQKLHVEIGFKAPSITCIGFLSMKLLLADCPIDDTHTWRYTRHHHDLVKVPLLGKALAWLLAVNDWNILQKRQDLPVAITQEPRAPVPGCDRLVRADAGIAAYLKLRRRMLDASRAYLPVLPPHVAARLVESTHRRLDVLPPEPEAAAAPFPQPSS